MFKRHIKCKLSSQMGYKCAPYKDANISPTVIYSPQSQSSHHLESIVTSKIGSTESKFTPCYNSSRRHEMFMGAMIRYKLIKILSTFYCEST